MNIFVLDNDPVVAAQMQCDKHVVKMCLETAQILSTALKTAPWISDAVLLPDGLYRPTHTNHPVVQWARECQANIIWLLQHGQALANEYRYRFGKDHASEQVFKIVELFVGYSGSLFTKWHDEPSEFVQCMPEEYQFTDPVIAYRCYYTHEKAAIAQWTKRGAPSWWM